MTVHTWTVGDSEPNLEMTLNANLTGATVSVHIDKRDGTVIERAPTVVDPMAGTIAFVWDEDPLDLDVPGAYLVLVHVAYGGSPARRQTFRLAGGSAGAVPVAADLPA